MLKYIYIPTVRSLKTRRHLRLDTAPSPGHFRCRVRSVKVSTITLDDFKKYVIPFKMVLFLNNFTNINRINVSF